MRSLSPMYLIATWPLIIVAIIGMVIAIIGIATLLWLLRSSSSVSRLWSSYCRLTLSSCVRSRLRIQITCNSDCTRCDPYPLCILVHFNRNLTLVKQGSGCAIESGTSYMWFTRVRFSALMLMENECTIHSATQQSKTHDVFIRAARSTTFSRISS